jgi:hypothetical protein
MGLRLIPAPLLLLADKEGPIKKPHGHMHEPWYILHWIQEKQNKTYIII